MGAFDEFIVGPQDPQLPPTPAIAPSPLPAKGGAFDEFIVGREPAEQPQAAAPVTTTTPYSGSLVPFSKDAQGNVHFDPLNAGPIGAARRAVTLPSRVYSGETQMPNTFDPRVNDPRADPMIGEAINFAGTFGSGANPMVRSGDYAVPGMSRRMPDLSLAEAPTAQALKDAGGKQLEAFRNAPVAYNPQAMVGLSDRIENDLVSKGIFPENSPGLYKSIERMRDVVPPAGSDLKVEPANFMAIRENIASHFGKDSEHQKGVGVAFGEINKFLENPPEGSVLAGPAAVAAQGYKAGRDNYAAGSRVEALADIRRTADFRAASSGSGQNADNSLRSRIASHILNDRAIKGYSPEEIAALETVPLGTPGNNALRYAGNVLGGGGGAMAGIAGAVTGAAAESLGLGHMLSTAAGVGAPALGKFLKDRAGVGTAEALSTAEQLIKQRSPLFREQLAGQDLMPIQRSRDAIAQQLLRMSTQQGLPAPPERYDPENYL